MQGVTSEGVFWISKTLQSITELENDVRHVETVVNHDSANKAARENAMKTVDELKKVRTLRSRSHRH